MIYLSVLKCFRFKGWPVAGLLMLLLGAAPVSANEELLLELEGHLVQGGLATGRVQPGTRVEFADRQLRVGPEGSFVIGFHRDMPATADLILTRGDLRQLKTLTIGKRDYRIERIDGLPPAKVNPRAKAVLDRIGRETAQVVKARDIDSTRQDYLQEFIWPARGRLSGFYGSQRILNGDPKRPHFGVDVAAPVGTPVVAPVGGIVRLAHPDMFFSGGTLILDHGHGVTSTYIHLDSIEVKQGDEVAQGDLIATIGQTGRATGPHLDWRLNWFGHRLDPQLLVGEMPAADQKSTSAK